MSQEEKECIGKLFAKYEEDLLRYVFSRLKRENQFYAEDIVQTVFERIMQNTERIDINDENGVKNYALTVAHNLCYNVNRDNRRMCKVEPEEEETVFPKTYHEGEQEVCYRDLLEVVGELPEHYAKVVLLRGVQGLSFAKIGEIMGEKDSTVRKWMSRARVIIKNSDKFDGWK